MNAGLGGCGLLITGALAVVLGGKFGFIGVAVAVVIGGALSTVMGGTIMRRVRSYFLLPKIYGDKEGHIYKLGLDSRPSRVPHRLLGY